MGAQRRFTVDQSPLKPLAGFDLRPSDRVFRSGMPVDAQGLCNGIGGVALGRTLDDLLAKFDPELRPATLTPLAFAGRDV